MCDTLSELEGALRRYAASFDAGALSGEQAARAVRVAAGIEKMAATFKGLAAARAAGAWKGSGSARPRCP